MSIALTQSNHSQSSYQNGQIDPESFDNLLWIATNRFCKTDERSRLSNDQFKEAFYMLVERVKRPTLEMVSHALASCAFTPRQVAIYLAMEPMSVARPMLSSSPVLGQLDLLQIIESKGAEYAISIASRPDIGPSLVNRLRNFKDPRVQKSLSENYALVDDAAERSANALFIEIGKRNKERQSQKVSEVPASKQQTLSTNEPISAPRQKTAQSASSSSPQDALLRAAARGGRLETAETKEKVTHNSLPIADFGAALERAAVAHSRQAMATLMQKQTNITLEAAYQALDDKSGDTIAVFLKAQDVEEAQANRIQLLTFPTIGLSVQNAMRSVRFYKSLSAENCKLAVSQWPQQQHNVPVHVPVLAESLPVHRPAAVRVKSVQWASGREKQAG